MRKSRQFFKAHCPTPNFETFPKRSSNLSHLPASDKVLATFRVPSVAATGTLLWFHGWRDSPRPPTLGFCYRVNAETTPLLSAPRQRPSTAGYWALLTQHGTPVAKLCSGIRHWPSTTPSLWLSQPSPSFAVSLLPCQPPAVVWGLSLPPPVPPPYPSGCFPPINLLHINSVACPSSEDPNLWYTLKISNIIPFNWITS